MIQIDVTNTITLVTESQTIYTISEVATKIKIHKSDRG